MSGEKLVSIILPVYNGERYLEESICSVLHQTYQNWELIIIDDGSKDRTREISERYTKLDKRIFYFLNEKNMRLPRSLNIGFSKSRGEYLTWTSHDNRYKLEAIKKMVGVIESLGADFVFSGMKKIDENGRDLNDDYIPTKKSVGMLVARNTVGACFLYKRSVYDHIGEYNPALALVEDYDYWQRIIGAGFTAEVISEVLYEYRYHSQNLTSTMKQEQFYKVLEKTLLKNRNGFGKINFMTKYYFWNELFLCRKKMGFADSENPYRKERKKYEWYYFCFFRVPNKLKRFFQGSYN